VFYDNLKAVCEEKGEYLTRIIEECGGKRGSIAGWKRGAWPNSELVAKIAVRLNVSTDRLLLGKEYKKEEDDAITGISEAALRMAVVWDSLDEAGKAITLGDIYKRAEEISKPKAKDRNGFREAR
jgi:transcriptional regulator with XRE-family HTH domain